MYQFSYADIQTDSVADARDRERQVLSRSIELLHTARESGVQSQQAPSFWLVDAVPGLA